MAEPNESVPRTLAPVPTASGLAARLAMAELRRGGIDPAPLLARARVTPATLDLNSRVQARSQIEFLELSSRAIGDDFLGLTLAAQFDVRELGMLYYVAASSNCLGDAVRRVERYARVGNEALIVRVHKGSAWSRKAGHEGEVEGVPDAPILDSPDRKSQTGHQQEDTGDDRPNHSNLLDQGDEEQTPHLP